VGPRDVGGDKILNPTVTRTPIPWSFSPYPVAIPTALCRLLQIQWYYSDFRGLEKRIKCDHNNGNRLYILFPAPLVLSIRAFTWGPHRGRTTTTKNGRSRKRGEAHGTGSCHKHTEIQTQLNLPSCAASYYNSRLFLVTLALTMFRFEKKSLKFQVRESYHRSR
jgi:hypothetical protein